MPSKRKRASELRAETKSAKRAKSTRISEGLEGDVGELGQSPTEELCSRCVELGLPSLWASLKQKARTEEIDSTFSALVVQRLDFDISQPLVPICEVCNGIDVVFGTGYHTVDTALIFEKDIGLTASRMYQRGILTAECQKLCSESLFFRQGTQLVRQSDNYNDYTPSFSRQSTFPKQLIEPYLGRETFEPVLSNRTKKVMASPDYPTINKWIQHCSQNHPNCQPKRSNALNDVYLIDVDTCRLVSYPGNKKVHCEYFALSYVWGGSRPDIMKFGTVPKKLPRTIRDSMKVVKELGKKYLWVDSICINQSNHNDKMAQIDIMAAIYEGAYATIVALDGDNANSGLPGVSSYAQRTPQLLAVFGENSMIDTLPPLLKQLACSSWATRAWTLQEGLLSRRCIFFAKHQVHFSCNEMDCRESVNDEINFQPEVSIFAQMFNVSRYAGNPFLNENIKDEVYAVKKSIYEDIVNHYTYRKLSFDSDSLNAFSALITKMQRTMFPEGFLYGLPLADFRTSILWRQLGPRENMEKATRRNAPDIPSWSWAGWKLLNKIILPSPRQSYPELQPHLVVATPDGRHINVGIKPMESHPPEAETHSSQDEDTSLDNEAIQLIVSSTCNFYDRLGRDIQRLPTGRNSTHMTRKSTAHVVSSIANPQRLLIEGVLFHFPCIFGTQRMSYVCAGHDTPCIALPADLNDTGYAFSSPVHVKWGYDGSVEKIRPKDGADFSAQDFLLVSAHIGQGYDPKLKLRYLHLYWENGIAYRGGVVKVYVSPRAVERFFDVCSAEISKFWLQ